MPTVRALPFVEELLVAYLGAHPALTGVVAGRVSTRLPATFTAEPRVRLFRTGGAADPDDPAGYLDRASVQLDCYGATQQDAFRTASVALSALVEAPGATHSGAVLTAVRRTLGPLWSPDPETDVPRYIVGVAVYLHPAPTPSA